MILLSVMTGSQIHLRRCGQSQKTCCCVYIQFGCAPNCKPPLLLYKKKKKRRKILCIYLRCTRFELVAGWIKYVDKAQFVLIFIALVVRWWKWLFVASPSITSFKSNSHFKTIFRCVCIYLHILLFSSRTFVVLVPLLLFYFYIAVADNVVVLCLWINLHGGFQKKRKKKNQCDKDLFALHNTYYACNRMHDMLRRWMLFVMVDLFFISV